MMCKYRLIMKEVARIPVLLSDDGVAEGDGCHEC